MIRCGHRRPWRCLQGKRIELFDYTAINIVSIADTEKLINSTIAEVKQLSRDRRRWCIINRYDRVYYSNDPLTVVQGVSDAKAALLAGAGIGSISKLAKLSKDAIEKKQQRFRVSAPLVYSTWLPTQRVRR